MTNKSDQTTTENGIDALVKHARRVIVLVVGGTVVLAGIALLILPGPAVVVIPTGLAILATEFVWAKRLLRKVRNSASDLGNIITGKDSASDAKQSG
ncbi:MAG: hypothetical protein DHS20C16_22070 [Phycisphaerae bacterium]|nr:MAG: hypothetical protein DHS20C16_22070 [Phycisphaerae bacterium]